MKSLIAAFWAKIQFWKPKKKTPDYRFQNPPESESTWVEITSGKYSDVIYSYGKIKFSDEFGMPRLSFGYTILDSGHYDLDMLQNDSEFITIMGDVLTEIILDEKNGSTRSNDTEEPDLH